MIDVKLQQKFLWWGIRGEVKWPSKEKVDQIESFIYKEVLQGQPEDAIKNCIEYIFDVNEYEARTIYENYKSQFVR